MRRLWQLLREMGDAERARVLAMVSASAVIGLLYGLGGLSLYLRANYLATPTPAPVADSTASPPPAEAEGPTLYPTVTPLTPPPGQTDRAAPTLYPTLTPRPGA